MTRSPKQLLWPGSKIDPRAKKMSFSSAENERILGGIIKDMSAVYGEPETVLIEGAIINRFLPAEENARRAACETYMNGLREGLYWIIRPIIGCREKALAFDFLPLVDMVKEGVQRSGWARGERADSRYAEVTAAFPHFAYDLRRMTADSAKWDELQRLTEDVFEKKYSPSQLLEIITDRWSQARQITSSYLVLNGILAAVDSFEEDPHSRTRFTEVLPEISDVWLALEAVKDSEKLVKYSMAHGAYVEAPKEWLVANLEDAAYCDYAGVFVVKNGQDFNPPHGAPTILFFSTKAIREIDDLELLNIKRSAITAWPDLRMVYAAEVEPIYEYDDEGRRRIVNEVEYLDAPFVGMFELIDANKPNPNPFEEVDIANRPFGAGVFRDWENWG